jgi:hypothetical protein
VPKEEVVAVIRLPEIEEIFTVLDRRGISREAVVIPLTKRDPGTVRLLPNEKLEIVVPESQPVAAWLAELERHIDAVMGAGTGE